MRVAALALILCVLSFRGAAQVTIGGQTGAEYFKSAPTGSQRSMNSGRPSFGWEGDLFLDGHVSDDITALSTLRATESGYLSFEYLAIRVGNLTPLNINVQAGKFDLPFGNLDGRRFPRTNALFSLPLIYEYSTALPEYVTPSRQVLAGQGKGGGMRLLDGGMYDLGGMVFGSIGMVSYAFAVTSGTISATSYNTANANSDLGKVARITVTPLTGVTIGASYAWGAYMEEEQANPTVDVNKFVQKAAGLDLEVSTGHFVFYGEGVYNVWPAPDSNQTLDYKVLGYYLEGKYTIVPRLYVALRFGGLTFGNFLVDGVTQSWDYDVTEWEGGIGYFIDRNAVLKLVRRETRIHGGAAPKDFTTVLQIAVGF